MSVIVRIIVITFILIIAYLGYRRASGGCGGTCPTGFECKIPIFTGDSFCYCGSEDKRECGENEICRDGACAAPTAADIAGCPILGAPYTGEKDVSFSKCEGDKQCTLCGSEFKCIAPVTEDGITTYPCSVEKPKEE